MMYVLKRIVSVRLALLACLVLQKMLMHLFHFALLSEILHDEQSRQAVAESLTLTLVSTV